MVGVLDQGIDHCNNYANTSMAIVTATPSAPCSLWSFAYSCSRPETSTKEKVMRGSETFLLEDFLETMKTLVWKRMSMTFSTEVRWIKVKAFERRKHKSQPLPNSDSDFYGSGCDDRGPNYMCHQCSKICKFFQKTQQSGSAGDCCFMKAP